MVHPGITWTEMTRSQTRRTMPSVRWIWPIIRLIQHRGSPEKAARRVAYLACAPEAGVYMAPTSSAATTPSACPRAKLNREYQERAWQLGSQLVAAAPTTLIVPEREAANDSPQPS